MSIPPGSLAAVPLFPLPNVVLFPRAVLPLHIFEDRYKAMTADVLAMYHNVQETYLSTFQLLGSLGLLLGTVGLAVVLLRG